MLDRLERRRLDQVDHDRRRKHRNAPGADERRRVFWPDDKLCRSLEAKIDTVRSIMRLREIYVDWPILSPMSSLRTAVRRALRTHGLPPLRTLFFEDLSVGMTERLRRPWRRPTWSASRN